MNHKRERPESTINVLEILGNAAAGGMETHVADLLRRLPADLRAICLCPYESPFTATLRDIGCPVYVTPMRDDPPWQSIELAVELIRKHDIQVIHGHLPSAHALGGLAGALAGCRCVTTVHGRKLERHEIGVCRLTESHVIVVCQEAYGHALASGLPADRVHYIPNGVDTTTFTPERDVSEFRRTLGVPLSAPLVGFVGRIAWEKGPDKFVKMAMRVLEHSKEAHFVLIGEGPLERQLSEMIQRRGHESRIHMIGHMPDSWNAYPAFDLLVHSSRQEGMPLSVLEAMACGVPVVALAVGGVPEVVSSTSTGILISPAEAPGFFSAYGSDWEGLATAVVDMLSKPKQLRQMRQAARQRAVRDFDVAITAKRTAQLLRSLAAARKGEEASRAASQSRRAVTSIRSMRARHLGPG